MQRDMKSSARPATLSLAEPRLATHVVSDLFRGFDTSLLLDHTFHPEISTTKDLLMDSPSAYHDSSHTMQDREPSKLKNDVKSRMRKKKGKGMAKSVQEKLSLSSRQDLLDKLKHLDGRSKMAKEIKKQLSAIQETPQDDHEDSTLPSTSTSTRAGRRERAHTTATSKDSPLNPPYQLPVPNSLPASETQRVLSRSEERELVQVVKDYFSLLELQKTMASRLKHLPSVYELAEASHYSPATLESLLKLGEEAKNVLIMHNLRLVKSVAKKVSSTNGSAVSLQDLIEAGVHGLLKAIHKFDLSRGFKLSTYASWWIRQAMNRTVHLESGLIRLPENDWMDSSILKTATRDLTSSLGREPTDQELLSHLSWSKQHLSHIKTCMSVYNVGAIVPMDGAEGEGDERKTVDQLSREDEESDTLEATMSCVPTNAEQYAMEVLADQSLSQSLKTKLTKDEEMVVRLKLGLPLPSTHGEDESRALGVGGMTGPSEISLTLAAKIMGKNRETARKLFVKGMEKLKGDKELMALLQEVVDESRAGTRRVARSSNSLRKSASR